MRHGHRPDRAARALPNDNRSQATMAHHAPRMGHAPADGCATTARLLHDYNTRMTAAPPLATPDPAAADPTGVGHIDATRLAAGLARAGVACASEVVARIDSTNAALLARARVGSLPPVTSLLAAEYQDGGRGRLGRRWVTPPGSALTVSLAHHFPLPPAALTGLSLACGLAVQATLADRGIACGLKWPNDVLEHNGKLAGILIEIHSNSTARTTAVVGIGLNLEPLNLPPDALAPGALPPASVRAACAHSGVAMPDRTTLLTDLAVRLIDTFGQFASAGFTPFVAAWNAAHLWRDQPVELQDPAAAPVRGVARGVDEQGRLIVATTDGERCISSGEMSLRRAA